MNSKCGMVMETWCWDKVTCSCSFLVLCRLHSLTLHPDFLGCLHHVQFFQSLSSSPPVLLASYISDFLLIYTSGFIMVTTCKVFGWAGLPWVRKTSSPIGQSNNSLRESSYYKHPYSHPKASFFGLLLTAISSCSSVAESPNWSSITSNLA